MRPDVKRLPKKRTGRKKRTELRLRGWLQMKRGVCDPKHVQRLGLDGLGFFMLVTAQADFRTHQVEVNLSQWAELYGFTRKYLRRMLALLVELGYLEDLGEHRYFIPNYRPHRGDKSVGSGDDSPEQVVPSGPVGGPEGTTTGAFGGPEGTTSRGAGGPDGTTSSAQVQPAQEPTDPKKFRRRSRREEEEEGTGHVFHVEHQKEVHRRLSSSQPLRALHERYPRLIERVVRSVSTADLGWLEGILADYTPTKGETPGRVLTFVMRAMRGRLKAQYREEGVQVTTAEGVPYIIQRGADGKSSAHHVHKLGELLDRQTRLLKRVLDYYDQETQTPEHEVKLFAELGMAAPDPLPRVHVNVCHGPDPEGQRRIAELVARAAFTMARG